MPLEKCSANGTSGFRWGQQGKCYTGPGAKKKAIRQGLAEGNGKLEAFVKELDDNDYNELVADNEIPFATRIELARAKKLTTKKRDDMKDSEFAIIVDGKKMFPINDAAHVRNALSRLPNSNLTPEQKKQALRKIKEAAKRFGVDVSE